MPHLRLSYSHEPALTCQFEVCRQGATSTPGTVIRPFKFGENGTGGPKLGEDSSFE